MKNLRIVFFGTPDFAVASLKAIVDAGFHVVAAVTAIDKPSGRGHKLQAPPVKVYATSVGIPCLQPPNLKAEDFVETLRSYKADLQVVVAFRMLPEVVWNMPALGTYNVHASLLPDYRGAAPINWAIINGETETGVTTFKLKHAIDTGSILLQKRIQIDVNDNAETMHDKLMTAGAKILVKSVQLLSDGKAQLRPQKAQSTTKEAPKIFKRDCQIDWNKPARDVHNFIRGMSPVPGAFTIVKLPENTVENWKIYTSKPTEKPSTVAGKWKSEHNKIFVSCSDVWIELLDLQSPGKRRMSSEDFLRGLRFDLTVVG